MPSAFLSLDFCAGAVSAALACSSICSSSLALEVDELGRLLPAFFVADSAYSCPRCLVREGENSSPSARAVRALVRSVWNPDAFWDAPIRFETSVLRRLCVAAAVACAGWLADLMSEASLMICESSVCRRLCLFCVMRA